YGDALARGLYPAVILFVEIDPSRVDVNVHPQKIEVRFERSSEVHDAVRAAVASALSRDVAVPRLQDLRPATAVPAPLASAAPALARHAAVAEPPARAYAPHAADAAPSLLEEGSPAVDAGRRAVPLAQYKDSYIVAQDKEGLLLVDQHVAHERVLFE